MPTARWDHQDRQRFAAEWAEFVGPHPDAAQLVAFADGKLPVMERPALEQHLRVCMNCNEEVLLLERLNREEQELATGTVRRVLTRIAGWMSAPVALGEAASAALYADSRNAQAEVVQFGDIEAQLIPLPDGRLMATVVRAGSPVEGVRVHLDYLGRSAALPETAADDEEPVGPVMTTVSAVTSVDGLADLGVALDEARRADVTRLVLRLELPDN